MTAAHDPRIKDLGLLLIRLALAVVFLYHGGQKLFGLFDGPGLHGTAAWMDSMGFPLPMVSATLAGSAEFFGGLTLLIGTGARIAAVFMAFTMAVAVGVNGSQSGAFNVTAGGVEYPLTMGLILVAIILTGPGRWTIARLWHPRSSTTPTPARAPA